MKYDGEAEQCHFSYLTELACLWTFFSVFIKKTVGLEVEIFPVTPILVSS